MRYKILILLSFIIATPLISYSKDILTIEDSWIRQPPPNMRVLAAYMTLRNPTANDIHLVDVTSPDFESSMMHATVEEDGLMKMVHQDEILIPANGFAKLAPGATHIMLFDPIKPVVENSQLTLILHFNDKTTQSFLAPVTKTAPSD